MEKRQILYQDANTEVLRTVVAPYGPVIVKRALQSGRSRLRLARLRYEFAVLRRLAERGVPHIPEALALTEVDGATSLLLADVGASSLTRVQGEAPLTYDEVLHVAECVAQAMVQVHRARLVHKDINPNNIVYNRSSGVVQLIDFGIASGLKKDFSASDSVDNLEGTPPYLAPEQTGRLTRPVDYRTDFYCFGMTLYHLLTGEAPFASVDGDADLASVMHAILTENPPPLSERLPHLPLAMVGLVRKLSEKDPAQRYQGGSAILADLRCIVTGPPEGWTVGQNDREEFFELPQGVYGRDAERDELLAALDAAATGESCTFLVAGPSGIGKSSLIQEVQTGLLPYHGLAVHGKCDLMQRHVPFQAVRDALTHVFGRLLRGDASEVDIWARRLQVAVGGVGSALIELVPTAELLLGPQKAVAKLGPRENENRLQALLHRVLEVLSREHLLLLFIDDLQWADAPSLNLLARLVSQGGTASRLLLVAAYRDDDPRAGECVRVLCEAAAKVGARPPKQLKLGPLNQADIATMVRQAAHHDDVNDLAGLLHRRSGGNPFMLHELVKHLVEHDLVQMNDAGVWGWDLQQVEASGIPDDAAVLLESRLGTLHPASLDALSTAACRGDSFTLSLLLAASSQSRSEWEAALSELLNAALIIATDSRHRYAGQEGIDCNYRFVHDRVRQWAYQRLERREAQRRHLRMGEALLQLLQSSDDVAIFDVLEQLNTCVDIIDEPALRRTVAQLNYRGCVQAKRAAAYAIALGLAEKGRAFLTSDSWQSDYELARDIHFEIVEALYLLGDASSAEALTATFMGHLRSDYDRATLHVQRCMAFAFRGANRQAIEAGNRALHLLKVAVPSNNPLVFMTQLAALHGKLSKGGDDVWYDLPDCTDPVINLAFKALGSMGLPLFNEGLQVAWSSMALRAMELMRNHGRGSTVVVSYSGVVVLYALLGSASIIRKFAGFSDRACNELDTAQERGTALTLVGMYATNHDDIEVEMQYLDRAIAQCYEEGNVIWTVWAVAAKLAHLLFVNVGERFTDEVERHRSFVQSRDLGVNRTLLECGIAFGGTVHGTTANEARLDAARQALFDDALAQAPDDVGVQALVASRLVLGAVHGLWDDCVWCVQWLRKRAVHIRHASWTRISICFFGLIGLVGARAAGVAYPRLGMRVLLSTLRRVCGGDTAGLATVGAAIVAASDGANRRASDLFARGCAQVLNLSAHAFVAMAHEAAARHFTSLGQHNLAASFALTARARWQIWGGTYKLQLFEQEFGAHLADFEEGAGLSLARRPAGNYSSTHRTAELRPTQLIDLPQLIASAQAIADEVSVDALRRQVLLSVQKISAATRVVLLLPAGGAMETAADTAPAGTPLPQQFIQQTMRLREVATAGAHNDGPDADYFNAGGIKSALGAPLLYRNEVRGLLYLEQSLLSDAFASDQVAVVRVLASQVATALESAATTAQLESVVAERTQQLREAQAEMLRRERDTAEVQLAGGFAHEMGNALSSAAYPLALAHRANEGADTTLWEHLNALTAQLDESTVRAEIEEYMGDLHEVLGQVHVGLQRALTLTSQTLDYAEVAHLFTDDEQASVARAIDDALQTVKQSLSAHRIQLDVQTPPDMAAPIRHNHLYIVLRNLLANARDALAGTDETRPKHIIVRALMQANGLTLEIEDNGPGLSESTQKRLFQPFFTTKGRQGTGLGLGLSRKLVRAYGGELVCRSQPNVSTVFTVRLPSTTPIR